MPLTCRGQRTTRKIKFGEQIQLPNPHAHTPPHTHTLLSTYVSLLPVSLFIQTLTLQTARTCQEANHRPYSAEPLRKPPSVSICLFLGGMKLGDGGGGAGICITNKLLYFLPGVSALCKFVITTGLKPKHQIRPLYRCSQRHLNAIVFPHGMAPQ